MDGLSNGSARPVLQRETEVDGCFFVDEVAVNPSANTAWRSDPMRWLAMAKRSFGERIHGRRNRMVDQRKPGGQQPQLDRAERRRDRRC